MGWRSPRLTIDPDIEAMLTIAPRPRGSMLRASAEGDPGEVAQMISSAVPGAVGLELDGRVLTADPVASYQALLQALIALIWLRSRL